MNPRLTLRELLINRTCHTIMCGPSVFPLLVLVLAPFAWCFSPTRTLAYDAILPCTNPALAPISGAYLFLGRPLGSSPQMQPSVGARTAKAANARTVFRR